MWKQGKNAQGKDKYFIQNGDWTICKTGEPPKYHLWHKDVNHGFNFATADEAKKRHKELTKNDNNR